jgi:hypothetical protein
MWKQAYGIWNPPPHMFFPLPRYFLFYFSTMLPLVKFFFS